MHTTRSYILRSLILLLAASPFLLAKAAQALSTDRNQPLVLNADHLMVNDLKQTSTYQGNVVLTQGSLTIHADRLVVIQKGKTRTAFAYGNPVTFHETLDNNQGLLKGQAQQAQYNTQTDVVTLIGHAKLLKNNDLVEGNTITYNIKSTIFQVSGGGGGRVHAVFQPQDSHPTQPGGK
ncbi:MAG: lipopolysaccharide transport periplasmic protein LptA [Proteobacteria bacterium]|nr:lipopolysaccharide transport periplasmic protein LptA [Pseudomonadota bacterium]MDE3208514.1 lipopolysaccharide transport periplasmic protein LptA [Pseudomonadota bacterium]